MKVAFVGKGGAGKTTLSALFVRHLAASGATVWALASDAIRGALERHFGVRLAFQNCHRVAAFRLCAVGGDRYRAFVSPCGQLLNQSPELRDC